MSCTGTMQPSQYRTTRRHGSWPLQSGSSGLNALCCADTTYLVARAAQGRDGARVRAGAHVQELRAISAKRCNVACGVSHHHATSRTHDSRHVPCTGRGHHESGTLQRMGPL